MPGRDPEQRDASREEEDSEHEHSEAGDRVTSRALAPSRIGHLKSGNREEGARTLPTPSQFLDHAGLVCEPRAIR
jgi:hypothetical protein